MKVEINVENDLENAPKVIQIVGRDDSDEGKGKSGE